MRYLLSIFILFRLLSAIPATAQQWEDFYIPDDPKQDVGILRTAQQNVYVVAYDGLYRSKDEGVHWQQIRQYTSQDGFRFFEVNRQNNRLYYSQAVDTSGFYSLYSSNNLGDTWTKIGDLRSGITAFIGDTLYGISFGQGNKIGRKWGNTPWTTLANWPFDVSGSIYAVKAENKNLWVAAAKGIYHSPDAGYNWEFLYPLDNLPPLGSLDRINLEIRNGEVMVVNEYANKSYFSKDQGASWQESGWEGAALTNSGENLYATYENGTKLFRFDGGDVNNWIEIPLYAKKDIMLDGAGEFNNTIWLGSFPFGVLRKPAESPTWLLANGDMEANDDHKIRFFDGHLFENNRAETFTADNGVTWTELLDDVFPENTWQNGNYHYKLAQLSNNTSVILRCLRNNRFEWEVHATLPAVATHLVASGDTLLGLYPFQPYKLFQSFDNGQTFNILTPTFNNGFFKVSKGKFYLTFDKSVYRSDDVGLTWQKIYTFPFELTTGASRFYIVHDTLLISDALNDQIFFSIDEGQTFNLLPAPQNLTTLPYRLRTANDVLALLMGDGLLYLSHDVGQTWISVPTDIEGTIEGNIGTESWGFGNNTLFTGAQKKLRFDDKRQVSGKVFLDTNSNGQLDTGEKGLNGIIVKGSQGGALANSYHAGDFTTLVGTGADAFSLANVPANFTVTPTSVAINAGMTPVPPMKFALQPVGMVNDAVVTLTASNAFKAGFDNTLYADVKNVGTLSSTGQLKLALNPLLTFLSASPAADAQIGDTLIWNYSNLAVLSNWQVKVEARCAVIAPGTPLALHAQVLNGVDAVIANNLAVLNEQVVAAFDPNDKTVSETNVPVTEADEEALVYTIRFQNLGNTATDFITIRDTLSDALDVSSVQVLAASHPFFDWRLEEGHILVFRFSPIRLTPVSEDTLRSQGFVKFAVRLKAGLEVGDEIANTAHIYFDFNPAVVTNTVVTEIAVVSTFEPSQKAAMLDVFPNPASAAVTLLLPETATGQKGRLEVFTAMGQLIWAEPVQGNRQEMAVQDFSAGLYWCRWQVGNQEYWGKLLVQR
jgi:Secretion system C-terminal sorting domain